MSTIQSVERACAVLFELERANAPMSTAELARRLELDRTVVHRLLRTLQGQALVEGSDGRYWLGARTLTLGNAYVDRLTVRHLALPYAVDLRATACTGHPWVVYLSVPVGDQAVTIDRIWGPEAPLDTLLSLGTSFPMDASAAGRSMLSFLPTERLVDMLGATRAKAVWPRLEEIRADGGVELNRGEHQPDICGISAAVVNGDHEPVASLSVSGLQLEEHLDRHSPLALKIRRAAQSVGHGLARTSNGVPMRTRRERAS